jgi:hypothetical protein
MYYGVKDCCKLAFYDKSSGDLFAYFPFGNSMGVSITGDSVTASANGSTIITWQANRKAEMNLESDTVSPQILTIVLGATHATDETGTIVQYNSGKFGTSSATFTLAETPSTGTLSVFLVKDDGATIISELTAIGSAPTAVQYSITGKVITTNASNAGANVLCIYAKDGTNIDHITIKSSEFSKPYKVVGLGVVRGVDGVDRLQEVNIPSATAQSNVDFTYNASEASKFSFKFDLAADPTTDELVSFKTL